MSNYMEIENNWVHDDYAEWIEAQDQAWREYIETNAAEEYWSWVDQECDDDLQRSS